MNNTLKSLLITGGLLGAGYLAFHLSTNGESEASSLTLEQTKQIGLEIRHQVMVSMYEFVISLR